LQSRLAAVGQDVDRLRQTGLYGTPSEILDRLSDYHKAGSRRVYLQVLDLSDLDHIRELGESVLPHARSLV
jgi:alkanesulfonate monooxygenase SsuD/methylene tetrahydromethanopterin reductase-like flavin-dependent oxidoreductase (luciferase family)